MATCVQILTKCREMAVGNTFGATALSSYGGFWISFAIVLTPGGFEIVSSLETAADGAPTLFYTSLSFFLFVCHDPSEKFEPILTVSGMVYLYHRPASLHSQVDTRLLSSILHSRYGLPYPCAIILVPRCRWTQRWAYKSWWCVRYSCSFLGLVQRTGRYRRYLEQLLHHPCRSPAVVRDWKGEAFKEQRTKW